MAVIPIESIRRFDPPQPKHLATVSDGQVPQDYSSFKHDIHVARRAVFHGRRTLEDLRDTKRPEQKSRVEHFVAGHRLRKSWDLAKRAANGQDEIVRIYSGHDAESYATVVDRAAEHPQLSDHNRSHERRVRLHTAALLENIGEIRHIPGIAEFLPAAASFAPRHDRVQLLRQVENLSKTPEEQLTTKF